MTAVVGSSLLEEDWCWAASSRSTIADWIIAIAFLSVNSLLSACFRHDTNGIIASVLHFLSSEVLLHSIPWEDCLGSKGHDFESGFL